MRPAPLLQLSRLARTAMAVLLFATSVVSAQDVTEPVLKALFLYHFAFYTEWPTDALPTGAPLVICVVGDTAVADAVQREVKGRKKGTHEMTVTRLPVTTSPPRNCQVLYVSGAPTGQLGQVIGTDRDAPVLTISDVDGFPGVGGITQFYFEHGSLKFTINNAAAKRARLQLSSKVLQLAKPR
jgi:hypothetical protein